jgi:hypothetical protein
MVDKHPRARLEMGYLSADFNDLADRFVAENERHFLANVPGYHVAGTDSARTRAHQRFTRAGAWHGFVFQANVEVIVQAGDLHRLMARLRT